MKRHCNEFSAVKYNIYNLEMNTKSTWVVYIYTYKNDIDVGRIMVVRVSTAGICTRLLQKKFMNEAEQHLCYILCIEDEESKMARFSPLGFYGALPY